MKVWVRPKRGLLVHDHNMGDRFPPEGREVERDMIIERRIIEGALIEIDDPTTAPSEAAAKTATSTPEAKSATSKVR